MSRPPIVLQDSGRTHAHYFNPLFHTFTATFRVHDTRTASITDEHVYFVVVRSLPQFGHLLARGNMMGAYQNIPETCCRNCDTRHAADHDVVTRQSFVANVDDPVRNNDMYNEEAARIRVVSRLETDR